MTTIADNQSPVKEESIKDLLLRAEDTFSRLLAAEPVETFDKFVDLNEARANAEVHLNSAHPDEVPDARRKLEAVLARADARIDALQLLAEKKNKRDVATSTKTTPIEAKPDLTDVFPGVDDDDESITPASPKQFAWVFGLIVGVIAILVAFALQNHLVNLELSSWQFWWWTTATWVGVIAVSLLGALLGYWIKKQRNLVAEESEQPDKGGEEES